MEEKNKDFIFEEITTEDVMNEYTAACSGSRSDCCTRTCTRNGQMASEEEWGEFLELEGGVIQY